MPSRGASPASLAAGSDTGGASGRSVVTAKSVAGKGWDDDEEVASLNLEGGGPTTLLESLEEALEAAREGLNGVLFAMSKKQSGSSLPFLLGMFIDFLQMCSFSLPAPEVIGNFNYPPEVVRIANLLNYSQFGYQLTQAFTVETVLIFCLVLVVLELANLFYVGYAWMQREFRYLWTIKLLRTTMTLLVGIFFIPIVSVMANVFTCRGIAEHCPVLLSLTVLQLTTFMVVSLLVSLTLFDPRPSATSASARAHSRLTTLQLCLKTVSVVMFSILRGPDLKHSTKVWWTLYMLATTLPLAVLFVLYQPYFDQRTSTIRAVLSSVLAWFAFCSFLHVVIQGDLDVDLNSTSSSNIDVGGVCIYAYQQIISTTLFGGLLVVIPLAWFGVQYRRQTLMRRSIPRCRNVFEVELKCRLEIQGVGSEHIKLFARADPAEVRRRAERVHIWYIEAATRFSQSSSLCVFHAHVLLDFLRNRSPLVRRAILIAEKRGLGLDFSFLIYKTKQLLEENAEHGSDVLGMVQSVKYTNAAAALDKLCSKQLVEFWTELSTERPDPTRVRDLALSIAKSSSGAKTAYINLFNTKLRDPQVLHRFGSFLVDIMNDTANGVPMLLKAHRLQLAQNATQDCALDDISSKSVGVLTIGVADHRGLGKSSTGGSEGNEGGEILRCNAKACELLNASSQTLVGTKLKRLLLPPLRDQFEKLVHNFIEHGDDSYFDEALPTFIQTTPGRCTEMELRMKPFAAGNGQELQIYILFTPKKDANDNYVLVEETGSVIAMGGSCFERFHAHGASGARRARRPIETGRPASFTGMDFSQAHLSSVFRNFEDLALVPPTPSPADGASDQLLARGAGNAPAVAPTTAPREARGMPPEGTSGRFDAILDTEMLDGFQVTSVTIILNGSEEERELASLQRRLQAEDADNLRQCLATVWTKRFQVMGRAFVQVFIEPEEDAAADDGSVDGGASSAPSLPTEVQSDSMYPGISRRHTRVIRASFNPHREGPGGRGVGGGGGGGGGGNGDDDDDRASHVSGAVSKSEILRSKAVQLRRELSRSQNNTRTMDPTLSRLRSIFRRVFLVTCGAVFYTYWKGGSLLDDFVADVRFIDLLGLRRFCMLTISYATHHMMMVQRGFKDASFVPAALAELKWGGDTLKDIDSQIYMKRAVVGGALQDLYELPQVAFLYIRNGKVQEDMMGLYDATLRMASLATQANLFNESDFYTTEPTVFSLLSNLDGTNHSLLDGLQESTDLFTAHSRTTLADFMVDFVNLSLVLCAGVTVLVASTLYSLVGNGGEIENVKLEVLEVFLNIPKATSMDVAKRYKSRLREVHGIQGVGSAAVMDNSHDFDDDDEHKSEAMGHSQLQKRKSQKIRPSAKVAPAGPTSQHAPDPDNVPVRKVSIQGQKLNQRKPRKTLKSRRRVSYFTWRKTVILIKMSSLLLLTVIYFAVVVSLISAIEQRSLGAPAVSNYAGYRRMKSRHVQHEIRMWITNTFNTEPVGTFLHPNTGLPLQLSSSREKVRLRVEELREIHNKIVYGSLEDAIVGTFKADLSASTDLMDIYISDGCLLWPANATKTVEECRTAENGLFGTGLQSSLTDFMERSLAISYDEHIQDIVSAQEVDLIRELLTSEATSRLFDMEDYFLQPQLTTVLKRQAFQTIERILETKDVLLGLVIAYTCLSAIVYLFVVRALFTELDIEVTRTRQLVLVIPEDVLERLKHVQTFFVQQFGDVPNLKASAETPKY